MCTVTYLPYRDGFILTHNRDEAPTRSPNHISREKRGRDTLIFPKDTKAGGAWIGASGGGRIACVLNGAFLKHQHRPPYRRSRGLVLLDFFESPEPDHFIEHYDLDGIEPFTFLYFTTERVTELRWDGALRHRKDLPVAKPHFWCSATLYPPPMQARREHVFHDWLNTHFNPPSIIRRPPPATSRLPSAIHRLHFTGSVGDPENDYVMNREGRVRTVSITQIVVQKNKARMRYSDLLEGYRDTRQIQFDKKAGLQTRD